MEKMRYLAALIVMWPMVFATASADQHYSDGLLLYDDKCPVGKVCRSWRDKVFELGGNPACWTFVTFGGYYWPCTDFENPSDPQRPWHLMIKRQKGELILKHDLSERICKRLLAQYPPIICGPSASCRDGHVVEGQCFQ